MGTEASPSYLHGSQSGVRTVLWLLSICSAFAVTHTPPPKKPAPMVFNDKFLHFMGFCALGVVTIWRSPGPSGRSSARQIAGWLLFLMAYAAMDEWTQELVGRDCELGDWIADGLGALVGMTICAICSALPKVTNS